MKTAKENFSERLLSQKRHPVRQKLLSVLLCACLLLASLPMEGYGSEVQAEEPQRKILSFSQLPEEVKYQTVEPGTPLEELNLPETLEGVCVPVGQENNVSLETLVQPEGSPEAKGTAPEDESLSEETQKVSEDTDGEALPEETQDVSDNENSEAELPTEHETEKPEPPSENGPEGQPESPAPDTESGTEEVPEENPEAGSETNPDSNSNTNTEETVVIEHVTWTGTPAYDSETEGVYVFTLVLPEGYVVAEGVELPEIQVTVKSGENSEGDGEGQETVTGGKKEESETEEELAEEYLGEAEEREYGVRAASNARVISQDETWDNPVTLSNEELVINEGVTLTINSRVTIIGKTTIRGGGTIARGNENADILMNSNYSNLTIQEITIDGKGLSGSRAMIQVSGLLTVESGCKIQNCKTKAGDNKGGAIEVKDTGRANINDCIIEGCSSGQGGAIANFGTLILDEGCRIQSCDGGGLGGAVMCNLPSMAIFNKCTIEDCHARYGGAIGVGGQRSMGFTSNLILNEGCKIKGCSAETSAGAVYLCATTAEFNGCTIENCSATREGGAVSNEGGGTLTINGGIYRNNYTTISEHPTAGGGFLSNFYNVVRIYGGYFINNTTAGRGGAIFQHGYGDVGTGCRLYIYGGTFQGNSCSQEKYKGSGGIWIDSTREFTDKMYFEMSDGVKFCGNGTDSGMDGIYLDFQYYNLPRKIIVSNTLGYPTTVYLEAKEHYVIAEGTDGYHLTMEDLKKFSVVDTNDGTWYKKLDTDNNQIYLTKDDPGYDFRIFYYNVDGKVTDDTEYGSGASAIIKPGKGLADPIPHEERFLGWREKEDGTGTIYKGGETVVMTKDFHLYPVYEKKTLSADFYSGGPDPSEPHHEEQEVEEDVESETIAAPALQDFPGWTPLGWTESAAAYESTIAEDGDCTLTEEGKKYYGVYQKEVTLIYDSADKTVTADVIMPEAEKAFCHANVHEAITYQKAAFTLPSGPEVSGYTFKGWSEQGDGSGTLHEAGTEYSIRENDTLYAVYEEKEKKTFTADFYSGSLCQPQTVSKTEEEPVTGAEITAPSLTAMEGWTPVGWEKESPSFYNGDVKPNDIIMLDKDKTDFYGIYQKEVTLTCDSADKAITTGIPMPEEEKALCYANVHKDEITYKEADFILPSGPEVPGYIFKGWSEQEDGSGTLHEAGTKYSIREDDTLYAVCEEKGKRTFTADFYSGDPLQIKSESDTKEEEATEGTVTVPSPETITGWTFLGWNKNKGAYTADSNIQSGRTLTLTEEKTEYYGIYEMDITLTYNANGGDSTPPPETGKRYANVHETTGYQDPDFTIAPAIHREDHTFVEWNTEADGTGERYTAGSRESFTENTALYAVFIPKGQKQFNADFYSGGPNQKETIVNTVEDTVSGADITVPELKEMAGWTPLGWSKSKEADTADDDLQPGRTLTLTEPLTEYYGIYKKSITLSYDSTGGGTAPEPEKKSCYASVHQEITEKHPDFTIAPAIRRTGYTFVEWNTEADGTGTSFEPGSTRKLDENTLLYAVWKETSTAPEPSDPTGPSEPEPSGPGTLAPETALYQVEYYCQNLAGEEYTRMDSDTELLTGTVGTEVEASRKNYTGFTLNLSHPSGKQKGTVEGDGSLVLKLYYDRIVYEVDFNLNGGYGKAPDTQKIRYGGLLNPVSDPLRRGYNFKGWYMDDKGMDGGIWDFGSPVEHNTGTLHTTLYAKWADELAPEMGKASFSRGSRDFLDWLIQKKSMVITVPVTEEGSGLSKAEYLLVAEDGTEQEGQAAFTETHTPDTMAAYGSSAAVIRSIRGEAEKGSYEARIAIEEEFKGKVYLTCTDHAGNVSPQKTLTAEGGGVIVEDNAPEIRFEGTEETTGGKPLEIKVKVRDNREDRVTSGIAGIRYQADKGKKVTLPEEDFAGDFAEACEFTVKIKGEGKHTLRVEAEDQAGNESAAEVTLNISGKREVPAEVPGDSEPGNPGRPGRPLGGEPKTGDSTQIQICATLAMIAGFGYLLLYFEGENGITEEEKEEIIYRMVTWAKQGGRIRRLLGLAGIFLFLAYYHSIGKSVDVEWKEVYGRN